MWSSKGALQRAFYLKERGYLPQFESGQRVARGFADLGYEEFCLIKPGEPGEIVSLFTGERSKVSTEDANHLFVIPSIEETTREIYSLGFDIDTAQYDEGRSWKLVIVADDRARYEFIGPNLLELFLEAFIFALTGQRYLELNESRLVSTVSD